MHDLRKEERLLNGEFYRLEKNLIAKTIIAIMAMIRTRYWEKAGPKKEILIMDIRFLPSIGLTAP